MSEQMAGWYPDPVTPAQLRYWDGLQWTEHIAGTPTGAAYVPPQTIGAVAYASWGQRVASYLIDALIAAPFSISAIVLRLANTKYEWVDHRLVMTQTPNASVSAIVLVLNVIAILVSVWNIAYRQGTTGYSIGKQVLGIKLVREKDGQLLGMWPAFGRNILHALDFMSLFIGFLWPLWDDKRQTFADKIIRSVVIVEPRSKS